MKPFLIFILCLSLVLCTHSTFAQTQTVYTIQIASLTSLESARDLAERISRIVSLGVRLERSLDKFYAVRVGAAEDQEDLIPHLKILKNAGYSYGYLRRLPYSKEKVVLEIPSSTSASDSSEDRKKKSLLLALNQKEQQGVELKREPDEMAKEEVLSKDLLQVRGKQSPLIGLKQKEQSGTGLIQETQEEFKGQLTNPRPKQEGEGAQYLAKAWQDYKARNYKDAVAWFTAASEYPETSMEAKLGLAYSYLKVGEKGKSLSLLEELYVNGFHQEEILPNVLNLLLEKGDYNKATFYIAKLGGKERKKWNEEIENARVNQEFNQIKKRGDLEEIIRFTEKNRSSLTRCIVPEVFYNTARILTEKGAKDKALDIYNYLLKACPTSWTLRLGIFYELNPFLPFAEMRVLVDKETERSDLPIAYSQKLTEIKLDLLRDKIATLPSSSPESKKLAEEILAILPEDPSALDAMGWWYYHNKEYKSAHNIFFNLYRRYPENMDYARGLTYTLIELDEDEEALDITEKSKIAEQEKKKIKTQIYLKNANKAYEGKNYAQAESYLQKLLALNPENNDAKGLLAWTFYNQGKFDAALPIFLTIYEKEKKPDIAEGIIYTYEKIGERKKALDFNHEIAKSENESFQRVSGKYFLTQGMPITAAQVYSDPETPYYHADKPVLAFSPFFRHKSGSSGLSKLDDVALPFDFSYPYRWGNNIRFSFVTEWLSSGDAPSSPFAGSFVPESTQKRDLIDSLWVFTPQVSFEKEGYTQYSFGIGITPLNGPVYPVPTFFAEAGQKHWRFNLHQSSIKESILSYVGLEDPYSNREWGRVLRTGGEAEVTFTPLPSYWLTLIAGYDYYWGNNVEGNNAFHGTISFGKTLTKDMGDISVGLFITGKHFSRNSDFFTFGHGGYFSPEIFFMSGPTISIETKPYKSFWFNGQGSVGFLYFRTEDAPFFPLSDGESDGKFKGDSSSKLGLSGQLEGLKLFTSHLAGGVFFGINNSADFTEWASGLTLRYYFATRMNLLPQEKSKPRSLR